MWVIEGEPLISIFIFLYKFDEYIIISLFPFLSFRIPQFKSEYFLRKYYQITDLGSKRIDEFMNEWSEVEKVCKFIREKGTANE